MARKAQIIDQTTDTWGDLWDVRERRPTPHGFSVDLGWPAGSPRGRGGSGGPRVIITPDLRDHFENFRREPSRLRLPIGASAIKRVRRLLGHHRQIDAAKWWDERIADLSDLTLEEFAEEHGVSVGAASQARAAYFGRRLRPAGWWAAPDVASLITGKKPMSYIADLLDISVGAVGRLRWMLRKTAHGGARAPRHVLMPKQIAEAQRMYMDGAATETIGLRFGLSASGVQKAIGTSALGKEPRKRRVGTLGAHEVIALFREGMSISDISKRADTTYLKVRDFLRGQKLIAGYPRKSVGDLPIEQVLELFAAGEHLADIADLAGVKVSTVRNALHQLRPAKARKP